MRTEINNRDCLCVSGADAKTFLQGLITNDLDFLDEKNAIYACFLTPQGKFLHDFIITKFKDGYILEVLKEDSAGFQKRLKMYALRSDVKLEILENFKIYAGWGEDHPEGAYDDPRLPELGWRYISENMDVDATFEDYDLHRIKLTVPDGSRNLKPEIMTVYDGNIDLLNGIALQKGCYLGQELTARIHYRGLVKKRLFTITFDKVPADTDIKTDQGALAGEILATQEKFGLALIKLSMIDQPLVAGGTSTIVQKPDYLSL